MSDSIYPSCLHVSVMSPCIRHVSMYPSCLPACIRHVFQHVSVMSPCIRHVSIYPSCLPACIRHVSHVSVMSHMYPSCLPARIRQVSIYPSCLHISVMSPSMYPSCLHVSVMSPYTRHVSIYPSCLPACIHHVSHVSVISPNMSPSCLHVSPCLHISVMSPSMYPSCLTACIPIRFLTPSISQPSDQKIIMLRINHDARELRPGLFGLESSHHETVVNHSKMIRSLVCKGTDIRLTTFVSRPVQSRWRSSVRSRLKYDQVVQRAGK